MPHPNLKAKPATRNMLWERKTLTEARDLLLNARKMIDNVRQQREREGVHLPQTLNVCVEHANVMGAFLEHLIKTKINKRERDLLLALSEKHHREWTWLNDREKGKSYLMRLMLWGLVEHKRDSQGGNYDAFRLTKRGRTYAKELTS
jgi:hypothetical protein